MNAKPKTKLNRCVFVQKRNSVNGALVWSLRINTVCHDTPVLGYCTVLNCESQSIFDSFASFPPSPPPQRKNYRQITPMAVSEFKGCQLLGIQKRKSKI